MNDEEGRVFDELWRGVELRERIKAFVFLPMAALGTIFAGGMTAYVLAFLFIVRWPWEPPEARSDSITFDSPLSDRLFLLILFAVVFLAFGLWLTALLFRALRRT